MYVNDPIGDLLTRIRNGLMANHTHVLVPKSKMKKGILELLVREGFLASFEEVKNDSFSSFKIELKYNAKTGEPVITEMKRISKPSRRMYSHVSELRPYKNGYGIYIVSTSKGLLTDKEARKQNVGGELVCSVW